MRSYWIRTYLTSYDFRWISLAPSPQRLLLLGASSSTPPPWRLFIGTSYSMPLTRHPHHTGASSSALSSWLHRHLLLYPVPHHLHLILIVLFISASLFAPPHWTSPSSLPPPWHLLISASYLAPPHRSVLFADLGQRPAMQLWRWVNGPGQRLLARSVRVKVPLDKLVGDVDKIEALFGRSGMKNGPLHSQKG